VASLLNFGKGYLFAHRYQIGLMLGKGGMGTVYEAVHVPTARRRALKVMSYQLSGSPTLRQRFTREAQLGARIGSPYLVDVFDAGVDEVTDFPYLAMERLEGEDLARLSRRAGPLPFSHVIQYLQQAAIALQSCHAAGVVHRDIKPSNLFLARRPDGERRIKLLDLGIAKLLADGENTITEAIGTPAYMAPEQMKRGGRVVPATDSYALVMVAYTLLVGRGYFEDEDEPGNVFALAEVICGGHREQMTVRALRTGVSLPAAVDPIFARATAASPGDRYPSAVELVEALAKALDVPLPAVEPVRAPAASELPAGTRPSEVTTLRASEPATEGSAATPAAGQLDVASGPGRLKRRILPLALAAALLGGVLVTRTARRQSRSKSPSAERSATPIVATPAHAGLVSPPRAPPAGPPAPPASAPVPAAQPTRPPPGSPTARRRAGRARAAGDSAVPLARSAQKSPAPPAPPLYSRD